MTYHRGTLAEFNAWHEEAMLAENIPVPDGKIGYVNNQEAPQNQRTIAYSDAIRNPDNSNDYIWLYGKYPILDKQILTQDDVIELNWFKDET